MRKAVPVVRFRGWMSSRINHPHEQSCSNDLDSLVLATHCYTGVGRCPLTVASVPATVCVVVVCRHKNDGSTNRDNAHDVFGVFVRWVTVGVMRTVSLAEVMSWIVDKTNMKTWRKQAVTPIPPHALNEGYSIVDVWWR